MVHSNCWGPFLKLLRKSLFSDQQIYREQAFKILDIKKFISQKEKDSFLTFYVLKGPMVGQIFNQAWNTIKELGNPHEAQTNYIRATKVQFDYAEAFSNLGNIFKEMGQPENAELSLRQVTSLKPTHPVAHNNLGVILQELGKLDEAKASYELAVKIKYDYVFVC